MLIRCKSCFQEFDESFGLCPNCGYAEGEPPAEAFCLFPGTVIADRYIIGGMLGLGGFGITYKAWDKKLATMLAIKEYYPSGLVNRQPGGSDIMLVATKREREFVYGKTRFLEEARNMAKFNTHKNIVNVFDFFEANNTAYIVMEFLDGKTLSQAIQQQNVPLPYDYCINVATQVCTALKAIHKENILHRDVSPDNIMICNDGNVKLFDFGAARFSAGVENRVTVVVKPGFAPPEQYDKVNRQDPRTDIYALGATLYYAMTGVKPEESTNRKIEDTLVPPSALDSNIPENISNAIMRAMAVEQQYRFATADDFKVALSSGKKVESVQKERAKRWRRRALGICVSLVVIIGAAMTVAFVLKAQKDDQTLPDAELCLWYIQTGDEEADEHKASALESIVKNFTEEYSNVSIDILPVDKQEYLAALASDDDSDGKPAIFESSGLEVSEFAAPLPDELGQRGEEFIVSIVDGDNLKLATGIVSPIIYVNSAKCSLKSSVNLEEIRQQCDDEALIMSVDEAAATMYERFYGLEIQQYISDTAFDGFLNHSVDIYMGTSSDYYDVQTALPGEYSVIIPDGEAQTWEYASQWSISNLGSDDLRVAEAFLTYLVSPLAQDDFHTKNQSGELPVTRNALDEYVGIYGELQGVVNFLSRPQVAVDISTPLKPEEVPIDVLESAKYDIQKMDMSILGSQGETVAEISYDLVVLSEDTAATEKINQALYEEYQRFSEEAQQLISQGLEPEAAVPYIDTCTAEVTHNKDGIISIKYETAFDWASAGYHGDYYGKTFSLDSGDELQVCDLVDADQSLVLTDLKEQTKFHIRFLNNDMFYEDAEQRVDAYEMDDFSFFLENDFVVLCFREYELSYGTAGPITVITNLSPHHSKPDDLVKRLADGADYGGWSWLDRSPDGTVLFGQLYFEKDMTCVLTCGHYQKDILISAGGTYSLNGEVLTVDVADFKTNKSYHCQYHVDYIGDTFILTQISPTGPFYFYEEGTLLSLQEGELAFY